MSLEQAAFLAQIVSAAAVVASLVFVGIQLGQATKAVRASSSHAHSAMYHAIIASIIDHGEFARIWHRTLSDPSSTNDDDWVRFIAYTSALFRFYEASRVQWLHNQLDKEHWQAIEQQVISVGAQPGIKAWWTLRRHWHSEEFRRWFEALPGAETGSLYGRADRGPAAAGASRPKPRKR